MGMERYRAIVRLEEIRSFMEQGEYDAAKATADSIRTERLKDSADLFLLASVYRKCGEYDTAKEFLLRIYEKKITWRVLEELMEVCLAEKNPEEAKMYFDQYIRLSEGDPRNYIFEYRIGRQMHRPDEELLPILQTLKAEEYTEKYAYELAKLYHKLGREQECMSECADLILWFGEGTYVECAKALQAYYRGELSVEDIQQEAERRVQEAEERMAREAEERRAFEEEQRRLEAERLSLEEGRIVAEEEARRLEEEERMALESVYRTVAGERFPEEETLLYQGPEQTVSEADELMYEQEAVETEGADAYDGSDVLEEVYAEVAATEMSEPMWESDASVMTEEQTSELFSEEASEVSYDEDTVEGDASAYEQISLFAPQEPEESKASEESEDAISIAASYEAKEEPTEDDETEDAQTLSELGKELSVRLTERGIVFEDVLHEFARIERVRKQLVRMLEVVVTVRKKCHCLIITGEKKSGKTTLGTNLAKLLYELSYVKSPRVAKISGEKLNQINLYDKQEKLRDVCLIVERAGEMTEDTAAALLDFIQKTNVLGTVILEDNANAISSLLRNQAECNRMFNNRVHLPKYDSAELMCFALEHIREQDYEISRDAKTVLQQKIEYLTRVEQKEGRLVATMEFVKEALRNADYRNQGNILAMASAGNFRAADTLELTAEDFGTIR